MNANETVKWEGNKAVIGHNFFRWTFGVLEWLCLSVSLARDCSFMETQQWQLAGEWVWREGKGKVEGVGCEVIG